MHFDIHRYFPIALIVLAVSGSGVLFAIALHPINEVIAQPISEPSSMIVATAPLSTPCHAPTSVTLTAPFTTVVGFSTALTATADPVTTTLPLTYTWSATGQPPRVQSAGTLSDTQSYVWETPGQVTVTVAAAN